MRAGGIAGGAVVVAWLISAFYHFALFALMYFLPWFSDLVGRTVDTPPPFASVVGDPDRPALSLAPASPVPFERSPLAPSDLPLFAPVPVRADEVQSLLFGSALQPGSGRSGAVGPASLDVIGIGTGGGGMDRDGLGLGLGDGGPQFFGLGGEARGTKKIAYVVDRSGSMLTTFSGVVNELKESIGGLRRTQKFHVIFFNAGPPLENPPRRMVNAISAHKREAFEFLKNIVPGGSTDPRPAMRRAFAVEPDLIYFLTDGEFDANLLEVLDTLNRDRGVRIYTIAYVSQQGAALLERIAREHHGEYRFVSENEIFP